MPEVVWEVPITLTCEKLGKVNLPMFVKISGQERPPMNIALNANATGPNVVLDQNDGNQLGANNMFNSIYKGA